MKLLKKRKVKNNKGKVNTRQQIVNELHKPARRNFKRRSIIIKALNDLFQADLVEMIPYAHENKGYKYILVVINGFSKFIWTVPIKTKTGVEVTKEMSKILKPPNIPKNLQTDDGKEFFNKHFTELMKKLKINHYSTFSGIKGAMVERVNRTLKSKMWKVFTLTGNHKWLQLLPKVTAEYNNTVHSKIKMKPADVTKRKEKDILKSSFNKIKVAHIKNKFKVGDYVRISKYRSIFDKSYTRNWSSEVFLIRNVKFTNPTTYQIEDMNGEVIIGSFYEFELQKTRHPFLQL